MTDSSLFENADLVYSYTRADAIQDGNLIDVSELAKEAGFRIPVALTVAVFERYANWTEADNERQTYQDVEGRLWDILSMMRFQAKRIEASRLFELLCVPRNNNSKRKTPIKVTLKALLHSGDDGEPVITVMLPEED